MSFLLFNGRHSSWCVTRDTRVLRPCRAHKAHVLFSTSIRSHLKSAQDSLNVCLKSFSIVHFACAKLQSTESLRGVTWVFALELEVEQVFCAFYSKLLIATECQACHAYTHTRIQVCHANT